jgi:hypothetical protein
MAECRVCNVSDAIDPLIPADVPSGITENFKPVGPCLGNLDGSLVPLDWILVVVVLDPVHSAKVVRELSLQRVVKFITRACHGE